MEEVEGGTSPDRGREGGKSEMIEEGKEGSRD